MRSVLTLVLLLLIVAAGVTGDAWRAWQQPLAHPAGSTLELQRGTSWNAVVRDLAREGWLQRPRDALYLRLAARVEPRTGRIRAGEYALDDGLTVAGLLDLLVSGRVVQHRITLVEGWRLRDAITALHAHDAVRRTLPTDVDAAIVEVRERFDIAAENPEGWFLPETYLFARGDSDLSVLRRAHRAMEETLLAAWEHRDDDLPLSEPEELLILASIVERETGAVSERGKVAGVFARRLQIGMRLQTDPTVIYGLGPDFEGRLRRVHLDTDTPYNTYTRHGLPPTPICLPGRAALFAAAQPKEGTALYFVSRNDGTHQFSDTLREHNAAVRRYQLGGR